MPICTEYRMASSRSIWRWRLYMLTEQRRDGTWPHFILLVRQIQAFNAPRDALLADITLTGATLSPSITCERSSCRMQSCKIWSTFYSATAWRLCQRAPSLPVWIQIHLLYSCLHSVFPSKIFQGLILHLRLGIHRCRLKRVGLVPNSRSLLPQRNVGFPGSLDTVVRAGTAC